MWPKQTMTQWLFLRRLATHSRCKFLLEDTSRPDRRLNCPLHESRECHASDNGDMSPHNKRTQVWAWQCIYNCGTERRHNCKLPPGWKVNGRNFWERRTAARFLSFDATSLVWLFILTIIPTFAKAMVPFKHFMNRSRWIKLSLDECIPCPRGLPVYALRVQIHDSSFAVLFTLNALTCHYRSNCYDSSRYEWMKKRIRNQRPWQEISSWCLHLFSSSTKAQAGSPAGSLSQNFI